jgi:hypothetical protein
LCKKIYIYEKFISLMYWKIKFISNAPNHLFPLKEILYTLKTVLMSLAQLVWIMHKIWKIWGSNPDHQKKIHIEDRILKLKRQKSPLSNKTASLLQPTSSPARTRLFKDIKSHYYCTPNSRSRIDWEDTTWELLFIIRSRCMSSQIDCFDPYVRVVLFIQLKLWQLVNTIYCVYTQIENSQKNIKKTTNKLAVVQPQISICNYGFMIRTYHT